MIKFFRKIRQSLLSENKFSKYLLYAIGEIVLVVIGILIALQINNWNLDRKSNVKERIVLNQLREDFRDDLRQLDQKITMRSNLINSSIAVMDHIDSVTTLNESLLLIEIQSIIKDPTFDPIDNGLLYSGDINLIKNDSLKRLLLRWTSDVKQVQQLELEWQKMRTDILIPFLIEAKIARNFHNETWKGAELPIELLDKSLDGKLDIGMSKFENELSDKDIIMKLENIVSTAISPNQVANLQSLALRSRILRIQEIIHQELKNR